MADLIFRNTIKSFETSTLLKVNKKHPLSVGLVAAMFPLSNGQLYYEAVNRKIDLTYGVNYTYKRGSSWYSRGNQNGWGMMLIPEEKNPVKLINANAWSIYQRWISIDGSSETGGGPYLWYISGYVYGDPNYDGCAMRWNGPNYVPDYRRYYLYWEAGYNGSNGAIYGSTSYVPSNVPVSYLMSKPANSDLTIFGPDNRPRRQRLGDV